jgi:acyl-CoA reductase-like NAD-dependent aldehyde dehydrogenase
MVPLGRRLEMVKRLRGLMAEHGDSLAAASAASRGRPKSEVVTAEVIPLAEACRFLEREAPSLLATRRCGGRGRPLWLAGVKSEVVRVPHGVVLVIGPGNYPLLLPGVQVIQALVAGNAVVLKPGEGGTRSAELLGQLLGRSGIDPALFQVLPASVEAGIAAVEAGPDKVVFTGSATVGRSILRRLAERGVPSVMELSGCDAVIVRADADLDLVVRALVFATGLNAGATCMAPRRVLVHRQVATELEGRLAAAFAARPDLSFPLANAGARRARPLLEQAMARGAHLLAGQVPPTGAPDGEIRCPVILAGVRSGSRLLSEDLFAPVMSVVTVADDDDAVAHVNSCEYGLTAAIFSRDPAAAMVLARRLETGVVMVNDLIVPTADARLPFGGRRASGFGVTRGAEGLLEMTVPKVVTRTRGQRRPAYDPPAPGDADLFLGYLRAAHGHGWRARGAGLLSLLRAAWRRGKQTNQH